MREKPGRIAERFIIHFVASFGLVAITYLIIQEIPFSAGFLDLLLAAVSVFALMILREAYDVAHGGSLTKSIWDYVSWGLGCASAIWLLSVLLKLEAKL